MLTNDKVQSHTHTHTHTLLSTLLYSPSTLKSKVWISAIKLSFIFNRHLLSFSGTIGLRGVAITDGVSARGRGDWLDWAWERATEGACDWD
jgi:hypothetical protein